MGGIDSGRGPNPPAGHPARSPRRWLVPWLGRTDTTQAESAAIQMRERGQLRLFLENNISGIALTLHGNTLIKLSTEACLRARKLLEDSQFQAINREQQINYQERLAFELREKILFSRFLINT